MFASQRTLAQETQTPPPPHGRKRGIQKIVGRRSLERRPPQRERKADAILLAGNAAATVAIVVFLLFDIAVAADENLVVAALRTDRFSRRHHIAGSGFAVTHLHSHLDRLTLRSTKSEICRVRERRRRQEPKSSKRNKNFRPRHDQTPYNVRFQAAAHTTDGCEVVIGLLVRVKCNLWLTDGTGTFFVIGTWRLHCFFWQIDCRYGAGND
jgi:hypothetical protein